MSEQRFCQSCGMPMDEKGTVWGNEKDGAKNGDYCMYCYKDGAFTSEETMDEMIESCVPFLCEGNPEMTPEIARQQMQQFFPQLKRWKA